jgi:hypothetical protein
MFIIEERRKKYSTQIAKDADNIDYVLSLKELELTGNNEAHRRLHSENTALDKLYTDLAKDIVTEAKSADPSDWTCEELLFSHKKYAKQVREKKNG